uniref:CBFA2/RUNX1 partner transcriptional co-repressor 3 n=1 Tax=Hucho hucho TaxID=62062 RepID=A0A4W5NAS7_9TELE
PQYGVLKQSFSSYSMRSVHGARQEEVIDHRLTDREWAEEWKHLDNLLNCIMDMVEKTRRSLTVLRRCQEADREEMNHWIRRYSDVEDMKKGGSNGQPQIHRDFLHRPASGYLPEEIWRKAEEAVNEVKRQAMSELQKAVSDAERKAHEMISAERSKMERALAEARKQASEDALTVINQQEDSSESCWNCGRKASETCSGCNTARYCGSFCQHKDWEKHHHVCGQGLQGLPGGSSVPLGTPSSSAPPTHSESTPPGPLSLPGQTSGGGGGSLSGSPKEASSSSASRSTTPATPALLDATSR